MVPKHQILPFLSLLLLSSLAHTSWGGSGTPRQEYERWLKWNARNHQLRRASLTQLRASRPGKSAATPTTTTTAPATEGEGGVVDVKLESAETNKVRVRVTQNGSGDYKTITEALESIPLHNTRRVVLEISPGVYREKIHIPKTKPFVTLVGLDPSTPPTITGNDTASVTRGDGTPLRTFQSATVAVDADYFLALNIIFENTAAHEVGSMGEQAVALRISGTKAAFYNCSFYGFQDTLYDHKGLHYFRDCFIQGSVDFIFGNARSFYENCTLKSVAKKAASVTAQKRTDETMSSGFSFKDCEVTGSGGVYLGRPWGDFSRVVFSFTFMDTLVLPQGWSNWARAHPPCNLSVYYGEYKCSGPGSNMTGRVPWARALTDQEALPFIGPYYVEADSWLITPST